MTNEEMLNIFIGGYFGIAEMDEYALKVYVLKEIESYIKAHLIIDFDDEEHVEMIKKLPLKRKLQDSLLVVRKLDLPLELELAIKKRLKQIGTKIEL